MQPDEHGFLHPSVDAEKCTDCSLCAKKCPISAPPQVSAHTNILTGYAKDEKLLPASSSGAIFPVLAAEIIRRGGIVFGAAFNENFEAKNPYQRGFIKGLYSRNSCFSCKFKGIERCSDITLTDYWGVKGIQPEAYNPQGTSLILLHSDKGRDLLESCQDKLQITAAADRAFTFNPAVLTPIQKPARFDEFWAGYGKTSFYEMVSSCCEPTKEELTKQRWNKSLLARVIRKLTRCIRR